MLYPVILSGGTGSRLWPKSRAAFPKQLLRLTGPYSMLQETVRRLDGLPEMGPPVLVCNQEHRFLIGEQLREINVTPQVLMLEPAGRNTAPAVAVAALHLQTQDPDALMLVLPADHVISNVEAFHSAITQATQYARDGYLVTLGVVAQNAETGYGYIQRGAGLNGGDANGSHGSGSGGAYAVERFVEKPDQATAESYLASGDYFWNSGMYIFSARCYLEELETFMPEVLQACRRALDEAYGDLDFFRLGEEAFKANPSISIDYAVMEKTHKAAMIPIDIGWNDVGSWAALWEHHPKDAQGNVTEGDEVLLYDVRNSFVSAERAMIAAIGVEDVIIVETGDAILVVHKDYCQDVKKVVDHLQSEGRTEHIVHRCAYRPWGSYEGVDRGDRFQVKRITVNPGAKLSLQMHHHRAEHWVVVSGTAEVTVDEQVQLVSENESVYIPLGANHRLYNPGRIPLHLIEVQSGPYLGEDDIVRLEDTYGRPSVD
jgi:mannose-1-phosphate guanylyltransferase/mannose-6-phosphate isomerase